MVFLRLPPRIKVLEALGAIGDGRVCLAGPSIGYVGSSDGSRVYTVYVDTSRGEAYSDDNGTKYRRYIGYPIIAVLMLSGFLEYETKYAEALTGIPWRELNEKYKRYAIVERIVLERAEERGVKRKDIEEYVERTMKKLGSAKLRLLESPPLDASILVYKCRSLFKDRG